MVSWTEADLANYTARRVAANNKKPITAQNLPVRIESSPSSDISHPPSSSNLIVGQISASAKGRIRVKGMNKTEMAYSLHLEGRKMLGEVSWYRFEGLTLKLADDTRYTPDFAVMLADGSFELHEVKGHWEDDAKVKIKVAAEMFPFRFIAILKDKHPISTGSILWTVKEF